MTKGYQSDGFGAGTARPRPKAIGEASPVA